MTLPSESLAEVMLLLSESLVQEMLGVGLPSAKHFSFVSAPSGTVNPETSMILGGSRKEQGSGVNRTFFHMTFGGHIVYLWPE